MDNDFLDSIMPNINIPDIYVPDIHIPNIDALENVFATCNMISESVNMAGISDALTTVAAASRTISTCAIEETFATNTVIAETLNNSALAEISTCGVFSDPICTKAIESSAMASSLIVEPLDTAIMDSSISNVLDAVAGISALLNGFVSNITNMMAEHMQEISNCAHEIASILLERFRQFIETTIYYIRSPKHLRPAHIVIASRVLIFIVPPVKIIFEDFSNLIREMYLLHSRSRGSSDDDCDFLILSCN